MQAAVEDPEYALMFSLFSGVSDGLCGGLTPVPADDLGMSDPEVKGRLGEFYDCLESDEEFRSFFLRLRADEGVSPIWLSDKDLFVEVMSMSFRQDPESVEYLRMMGEVVEFMC